MPREGPTGLSDPTAPTQGGGGRRTVARQRAVPPIAPAPSGVTARPGGARGEGGPDAPELSGAGAARAGRRADRMATASAVAVARRRVRPPSGGALDGASGRRVRGRPSGRRRARRRSRSTNGPDGSGRPVRGLTGWGSPGEHRARRAGNGPQSPRPPRWSKAPRSRRSLFGGAVNGEGARARGDAGDGYRGGARLWRAHAPEGTRRSACGTAGARATKPGEPQDRQPAATCRRAFGWRKPSRRWETARTERVRRLAAPGRSDGDRETGRRRGRTRPRWCRWRGGSLRQP